MALKDLMRHVSVTTTEKYYVGIDAVRTIKTMREYVAARSQDESSKAVE